MAYIGLGAGVLLWFLPSIASVWIEDPAGADFGLILVLRWIAAVLLLLFVLIIERRPLSSVGIRAPKWSEVFITIGLALLTLVLSAVLYTLVSGGAETETDELIAALGVLGAIHLIVNAAVVEELFFRGFLMERVTDITGRISIAASVSFVVFVGSHVPDSGWAVSLTMTAAGSALFVGLYCWRRNLLLCSLAHAITNVLILAAVLG